MKRTAVILAGGKGTRLASVTGDIPKPMVPLMGKPVLEYQIELLARYGFSEVWILVNHLKEHIISHFGDGSPWGLTIHYYEETQPLGTTGGIKAIEDKLDQSFLVLYGDVILDMDLDRLWDFHESKNAEATLVIHPNDHPYDSDLLEIDEDDRVIAFHPKPHPEGFRYHNQVNAAVYVLEPTFLRFLEEGIKADFGRDIFPKAHSQTRMFGYSTPEYIKDMGTPDRMRKVEGDIESGKVSRRSLRNPQKAIFLDRDGVINPDLHLIHRPEDMHLFPFTAKVIQRINRSDYLSIVVTNQSIIARNLTDLKGLSEIHKKMETDLGTERAYLDAIYFCPHHPDSGYPGENPKYKVDCDCRKPKPGMLLQAAERFNIDLSRSFMIGDSERDIVAGRSAGCTTIGVKTGKGLRPAKQFPDFFFQNLEEAVDFILDKPFSDLWEDLEKKRKQKAEAPFVVSIAGNARSGKTSMARYLQREWELKGTPVFRIDLDDWILPKEQRAIEVDVFTNFRLKSLEEDIPRILRGEKVTAPGYRRHPEWEVPAVDYIYDHQPVVIIDGVVGLSSPALRALADIKIFKSIDKEQLHERFTRFYEWKGFEKEEIESLFSTRDHQEYSIIAEHEAYADIVL
ncbi:MAG: HAD-IIIA family hydrolase [Bacteroidota bacterium]|nr:HAD-IIIA family hydrolase [Bacteroidota bacterium]